MPNILINFFCPGVFGLIWWTSIERMRGFVPFPRVIFTLCIPHIHEIPFLWVLVPKQAYWNDWSSNSLISLVIHYTTDHLTWSVVIPRRDSSTYSNIYSQRWKKGMSSCLTSKWKVINLMQNSNSGHQFNFLWR